MKRNGQGVLNRGMIYGLILYALLPVIFTLSTSLTAAASDDGRAKNYAHIIYSADSKMQSSISKKIAEKLSVHNKDIVISVYNRGEKVTTFEHDVIINIGSGNIESLQASHPDTDKLLIITDPGEYRLAADSSDAILYMTQPYCRQIKFIREINADWKTIGLIHSANKVLDTDFISRCSKKYSLSLHVARTTDEDNITEHLKNTLSHSDILLALPDKIIYNRKTIKNILLTSYRHRKPVIGFSRNFVNAGALAAIYSSSQQIADAASNIVKDYFNNRGRFTSPVNYPDQFEASFNHQVFRAMDINQPDIDTVKRSVKEQTTGAAGELR